jgi:uncharacterized membrane protein YkvA (DUF1232 family)
MLNRWRAWAQSLKQETYALYLAARDPRLPVCAKIIIGLVVAYALSPIDLIPDFIPVLGYLDDLVLLPLGIALAVKMIPDGIWEQCRARARSELARGLPRSRIAGFIIMMIWLLTLGVVGIVFLW